MTALRQLHILRFRGVSEATWSPHEGVNGLIGAGDGGKSTLLDAIDFALTQRRNLTFTDADFFGLDVSAPIQISATLGDLPDSLQDLDAYGQYLRGWNAADKAVVDEPAAGLEVVLTMRLIVDSDLEPHWALYSDRAAADGHGRDLPFAERGRIQPTRLGAFATHHFSWGGRSVLNHLSDERASASQALAEAAREARKTFGDRASAQVEETLKIVEEVAATAGVRGAAEVQALLDAHGVSFSGGAIALHDGAGVPLRNLGVGSSRLLVANLQAVAGQGASISLIDELEHGLEPYRIARLLHTLGSKDEAAGGQVFLTTHSPICVRELAARQLWKVHRDAAGIVTVVELGVGADDQATLRACGEAFLAPHVLVCEGATEVGLARGLDLYWAEHHGETLARHGVALADGGGSNFVARALCFANLGFRTGLWRDSDVVLTPDQLRDLADAGVTQFAWDAPHSTEQQLFAALPDTAIDQMLSIAAEHCGQDAIVQHVANVDAALDLETLEILGYGAADRAALGRAAGRYKWFKTVDQGERVGREVLGANLDRTGAPVPAVIAALRTWIAGLPPEEDHGL
ncbi:ATP-binding protein [Phenylobacterium sp.]|jgi:hypothetical protein|uniref:ATP-dependent nuclease n=1 Tax=Phenylobacterium sp. TaxID=1871053 RepID=UPI002E381825|nr:ATP-binding protein [Phenylobacterium sp.]HEX4709704.1 ATP-binding protein [Phenylobacterium sp.]